MAKYRKVPNDLWENTVSLEAMTPTDKLFYLFLLTNQKTTEIGIIELRRKK